MNDPVLEVRTLTKTFRAGSRQVEAVKDLSFSLARGQALALVGESGSGKSTAARLITGLETPDGGQIFVEGRDFSRPDREEKRLLRRKVQLVFQNPEASFSPRMPVGQALLEALGNFQPQLSRQEAEEKLEAQMAEMGLDPALALRYPRELSGGQCQRAAILRALAAEPSVLICDEATSALDVLAQARILEILKKLCDERRMSLLFISHDLALASALCRQMVILRQGVCVEAGPTEKILTAPAHPYTKTLLESVL